MTFSQEIKKRKEGKHFSKILLTIGILLLLALVGYFFLFNKEVETQVTKDIHTVTKGVLKTYVSGEGKIVAGKKIELSLPVSGEVISINKKEGDSILQGDLIASVDNTSAKIALEKSKIALNDTYARLNDRKETVTDSGIGVLQKDLDLAKLTLESTKINSYISIDNSKNNIKSLEVRKTNIENRLEIEKSNLDLINSDENTKIVNLINTLKLKSDTVIIYMEKYLGNIDELFGFTDVNKNNNDLYDNYLGAKDTSSKTLLESNYNSLSNTLNNNSINLTSYNDLLPALALDLKELITLAIKVVDNSVESSNLTKTQITTYKTSFQSDLSLFDLEYQGLKLAKQNIDYEYTSKDILIKKQNNIIEIIKGELNLVNKDLEIANKTLINLEKSSDQNILLSENQLDRAKASYDDSISGPTYTQLKPYYVAIENAKNGVKQAENNLLYTSLVSPVDGTILDINYKKGEYFTSGLKPFGVVVSTNGKYIESYIEERDILKIYKDQEIIIALDALENYTFTGSVTYVSSKGEEDLDEVTRYKILISFNELDRDVKDYMSVTLDYLDKELKDIVLISSDYISYTDGVANVLMVDGTIRNIIEGSSDGDMVEILSGLEEGDKIVLDK